MASRDLKELQLPAQEAFRAWLEDCKRQGMDVLIYCTYRSGEEQNLLYAQGRTIKGPIVTNAKAGESFHQHRVAVDAVPLLAGKPQWGDDEAYTRMAKIAAVHGIEWAGNWKKFKEKAHFQYTQGLTLEDFQNGKELHHGT